MSEESQQSSDKRSSFPWKWLAMLVTTGLIVYLLVSQLAGGEEFIRVLRRADWLVAALSLVLIVINWSLAAFRWNLILAAMGYAVPFFRSVRVILATRPFDLLAPSRANDLLRPFGVRDLVPVMEASGSVIAQRVIDVQSLCLLAIIGGALAGLWQWAGLAALGLLAGWVALGLLFWRREWFLGLPLIERIGGKLIKLAQAFVALTERKKYLVATSLVSLLAWLIAAGIVYVLGVAFGAELDPLHILALWPLAIFVGMLPLTVAGMGTRDATFVSLLTLVSAHAPNQASVLAATFGYAVVTTGVSALAGMPFMLRYMHKLPESRALDEEGE